MADSTGLIRITLTDTEPGDVFDGTPFMFEDCFFAFSSHCSIEAQVADFANANGFEYDYEEL
jgi:hypothetical protein